MCWKQQCTEICILIYLYLFHIFRSTPRSHRHGDSVRTRSCQPRPIWRKSEESTVFSDGRCAMWKTKCHLPLFIAMFDVHDYLLPCSMYKIIYYHVWCIRLFIPMLDVHVLCIYTFSPYDFRWNWSKLGSHGGGILNMFL